VPEVSHAREKHRQPRLIRGSNYFRVADRAAGLDDGGSAGLDGGEEAVGEGEEGVGGDGGADRARLGPAGLLGGVAAFQAAMRADSRRFIWPAPMPAVAPFLA
jgi:hypothetical protein